MRRIDEIDAMRCNAGFVPVRWSEASERRSFELFASLIVWAINGPVTYEANALRSNKDGSDQMIQRHRMDLELERWVRVFKLVKQFSDEAEAAETKQEVRALLGRWSADIKDQTARLTNVEVCMVMMECSLIAPLSREATSEYMRAFAHVFGLEKFATLFGDPHVPGIDFNGCQLLRWSYGPAASRFPKLDEEEQAWIEDFNRRLKARNQAECWPGTNMPVAVAAEATR